MFLFERSENLSWIDWIRPQIRDMTSRHTQEICFKYEKNRIPSIFRDTRCYLSISVSPKYNLSDSFIWYAIKTAISFVKSEVVILSSHQNSEQHIYLRVLTNVFISTDELAKFHGWVHFHFIRIKSSLYVIYEYFISRFQIISDG